MTADPQHAAQSSPDLTCAWLYAANCSLYEDDDGPAQLNISSHLEPHVVSRVEAFRDLYSRLLLEELGADAARIAALARDIDRARRNNRTAAVVWDIAAELCQRAADVIDNIGAATDARARRKLLAGTKHLNARWRLASGYPPTSNSWTMSYSKRFEIPNPARRDVESWTRGSRLVFVQWATLVPNNSVPHRVHQDLLPDVVKRDE
ncbi:hypothetical protein LTQ55_03750 [Mycobacterium intracellulare]|uniref:hypothetical protein n=1 Tax=Mycobacterium intracellulare TaxID=1767 RepID=UPI001E599B8D|nr:hypothetical protein [Mycobacterium intracellulare]UGT97760.1 hypothetical protein LTQ55_03750 [Mycobacterium intracellulare]